MDARDERFEERLLQLGRTIDRKVGPSDPQLLTRLERARGEGRRATKGRPAGRGGQNRWFYWAAVLLVLLVAVPYVAHLTGGRQQAGHQHVTNVGPVYGKPIVLGAVEAVDFATARSGWVAAATGAYGSRNVVLETRDGGNSWTERLLPTGYTALALHFTGDRQGTGYVLAQETGLGSQSGTASQTVPVAILATQNGGRTWHVAWREQGPQALFNATVLMRVGFQFFGSQGYAYVGDRVLTSQDGFKGWTALTLPQGFEPVHMDFLTPRIGFVAGQTCGSSPQPGTAGGAGCTARLIETTDGGQTWQTSFTAPDQNYWNYSAAVSFPSAEDGWFFLKDSATWQGYLYRTTDGGKTWSLQQSQLASGRDVAGAPTFVSGNVGWLPNNAGAAPYTEGLLITRDGGKTWRSVGTDLFWSLSGVSLVSPEVGYAVGRGGSQQNGFLVKTVDGGRTWTQLLPSLAPTTLLDFTDALHGFGIGLASDPQAVLASVDGGRTWREIYRAADPVQAVSFVDRKVGYMVTTAPSGQSPVLLATRDGGRHWRRQARLPIASGVLAGTTTYLHFQSVREGIMQTGFYPDVTLSATMDGGKTWTVLSSRPAAPGAAEQFSFIADMGYTLQTVPGATLSQPSDVTLERTIDGGKSHDIVHTWQGSGQGAAVYFLNQDLGWVAMQEHIYSQDARTVVYATRDGGKTWTASSTAMSLQNFNTQLQMQFATAKDGWLMGIGSLYRTNDGGRTWQQLP